MQDAGRGTQDAERGTWEGWCMPGVPRLRGPTTLLELCSMTRLQLHNKRHPRLPAAGKENIRKAFKSGSAEEHHPLELGVREVRGRRLIKLH
jgi:hypothetical protein